MSHPIPTVPAVTRVTALRIVSETQLAAVVFADVSGWLASPDVTAGDSGGGELPAVSFGPRGKAGGIATPGERSRLTVGESLRRL